MRSVIVIFNNNERVQAVWKFLLETRGYRVEVARDKVDAIQKLESATLILCEAKTKLFSPKPVLQLEDGTPAIDVLEQVRQALRG